MKTLETDSTSIVYHEVRLYDTSVRKLTLKIFGTT
jgi:hypothetical protein